MASSPSILPLSPEAAYATKGNIAFPGTQAQATAAETAAQGRIGDEYPTLTVTVVAGSVKVAN